MSIPIVFLLKTQMYYDYITLAVDFVSAPFEQAKLHLYQNCESPDLFFRSSLRGLLADHCLKNLDMRYVCTSYSTWLNLLCKYCIMFRI